MKYSRRIRQIKFILTITLIFPVLIYSQDTIGIGQNSSVRISRSLSRNHSPQKAALLSTFLPGAGQIYNKKYWKAPIVWAGLAGFTYMYFQESSKYQEAKEAYLRLLDTNITVKTPYKGTTNPDVVQTTKNVYRTQRDMYLIIGILFYGLNIVDAAVDAHLFKFDVSDDLSLKMNFDMINYTLRAQVPSLNVRLNLKNKKHL